MFNYERVQRSKPVINKKHPMKYLTLLGKFHIQVIRNLSYKCAKLNES